MICLCSTISRKKVREGPEGGGGGGGRKKARVCVIRIRQVGDDNLSIMLLTPFYVCKFSVVSTLSVISRS